MILNNLSRQFKNLFLPKQIERPIFQWLNIIFNRVDMDRIQQYGPDRVCSEWLLKNGAAVKWVGFKEYLKDYNKLPAENVKVQIEKVDATGSSISHYGFMHFMGCKHITDVILSDCDYIENEAIRELSFLKDSLQFLNVSKCGNITDAGVLHIKVLSKLKTLELNHLQFVKDKEGVLRTLRTSLPNCQITTDFENKK